jgi:hypothetical protein
MGQSTRNKIVKSKKKGTLKTGKYMKFSAQTFDELAKLRKETGKNDTQIVEELVEGGAKFNPTLENWINEEARRRGISRQAAIEVLLFEAVLLKEGRDRKTSET